MLIFMFLVVALIAVAIIGLIVLVWLGIAREEADYSLKIGPSTRASAMTRRIVGLHMTFRP
jgi:hypothetical protein